MIQPLRLAFRQSIRRNNGIQTPWCHSVQTGALPLVLRKWITLQHHATTNSSFQSLLNSKEIGQSLDRAKRTYEQRVISTLEPQRLQKSDFYDISGVTAARYRTSPRSKPTLVRFHSKTEGGLTTFIPFPPGTHGFLYYFSPSPLHPTAGEIRFRITPNHRPSSFKRGRDLLHPNGLPWRINLFSIASKAVYANFWDPLLKDNLVSHEMLMKWAKRKPTGAGHSIILHSLKQPFPVHFDGLLFRLRVVSKFGHEHHGIQMARHFTDGRLGKYFRPYVGSGLACFERSTRPEHANTRTIVMRILKIIEPVKCIVPDYDGYLHMPTAGRLVTRGLKNKHVWSFNVDTTRDVVLKPLRFLLEGSEMDE